jgi:hypothetical protein
MRQKLITLDPTSWDLAAKKSNFSQWVRDQLRSERNRMVGNHSVEQERKKKQCVYGCGRLKAPGYVCCNTCIPVSLKYNDEEMMSNDDE